MWMTSKSCSQIKITDDHKSLGLTGNHLYVCNLQEILSVFIAFIAGLPFKAAIPCIMQELDGKYPVAEKITLSRSSPTHGENLVMSIRLSNYYIPNCLVRMIVEELTEKFNET